MKDGVIGFLIGIIFITWVICSVIDTEYFSRDKLALCQRGNLTIKQCLEHP